MKYSNRLLRILLAGVIMTLAFVLSACNLFQTVEDAEKQHVTPPSIENVEPDYDDLDWNNSYVNLTIECTRLLQNEIYNQVPNNIKQYIPNDGYILNSKKTKIDKGDTAFTVLLKECNASNIQIRYKYTNQFGYYVESINNIPERILDRVLNTYSGWMYKVNGVAPNVGMGGYRVVNGENITIYYVC